MATIAIIVAFSHIAADLDYELVREGNASLGLIRCQSCAPVKGKILIFGFQMWVVELSIGERASATAVHVHAFCSLRVKRHLTRTACGSEEC